MSNNSTANAHCDMSPRKGYCWRPSDRWFAKDCTFFQCRLSIWIPCTFFRPATPTLFSCNLAPVCYIFGDGPIIFSFFNVRLAPQFELGVPNPDAWCTWEIITCLHGGRPQRRPGGAHSRGRGTIPWTHKLPMSEAEEAASSESIGSGQQQRGPGRGPRRPGGSRVPLGP